MSKRPVVMIAVVAFALVGPACNNDGDQPSTGGSAPAESTGRYEGLPAGTYNAGLSEFIGFPGYLQLMADGTGRVLSMDDQQPTEDGFQYRVDGDRLVVTSGDQATWDCDPAEPGTYEWARVESALELDPVDEPCESRAAAMQPGLGWVDPVSWWSMGDVPIVEIRPGDDPVPVETPIGTIEWALVGGQPTLSFLSTFDGGFVGLAVSAEVVVSVDGRTWTPMPPPPVVPEWLGTRGREVWVASGVMPDVSGATAWPPLVHVTDDNGSTWKEIAFEAIPPGVVLRATGSAAGPAATVVTTRVVNPAEGPLVWVLGPEGFEPVTTPFEGTAEQVTAWALDSGFLARVGNGSEDSPGWFWTSPDGRSWTEAIGAPTRLRIQATYGDTAYGVVGRATDGPLALDYVASFDAGRTWHPSTPRPTGGLDGSDIGLVAVDGGGGWLCYGNAFASSDGTEWARALAPWPLVGMTSPLISGDTILIPSFDCTSGGESVHLIGRVVAPSGTVEDIAIP